MKVVFFYIWFWTLYIGYYGKSKLRKSDIKEIEEGLKSIGYLELQNILGKLLALEENQAIRHYRGIEGHELSSYEEFIPYLKGSIISYKNVTGEKFIIDNGRW